VLENPLIWSDVENNFLVKTRIGTDMDVSYGTVPISALVSCTLSNRMEKG